MALRLATFKIENFFGRVAVINEDASAKRSKLLFIIFWNPVNSNSIQL
jgi:hypothetical protein